MSDGLAREQECKGGHLVCDDEHACLAQSPLGWECSLEAVHTGRHVAVAINDDASVEVCSTWENLNDN